MAPPIPPEVRRYLDVLFTVGYEQQIGGYEQQRAVLFDRLNRFVYAAYVNSLSPRDRATLEHMIAAGLPLVQVEEFVHDHVPNLYTVYRNALAEFQTLYLREVARKGRADDD